MFAFFISTTNTPDVEGESDMLKMEKEEKLNIFYILSTFLVFQKL
jgi:hypothetical protein